MALERFSQAHKAVWQTTAYTSATNLSTNDNSGVTAFPTIFQTKPCFPMFFQILGNNISTDETLTLTLTLYTDAAGAAGSIGTITFPAVSDGDLFKTELWPGDISNLTNFAACPPWFQAAWALVGTTKSMGFTLYVSYWYVAD